MSLIEKDNILIISIIVFLMITYLLIGVMSYIPGKEYIRLPYTDREKQLLSSMRIAIHLTGEVRGDKSIESIYRYIINPLNADVFVNSSSPSVLRDKIFPNAIIIIDSKLDEELSKSLGKNCLIMFKRMRDLQTVISNNSSNNNNSSISNNDNEGNNDNGGSDYNNYNVVIRMRPDLIVNDYIPLEYLIAAASDMLITTPKNCMKHNIVNTFGSILELAYTDMFFFSSPKIMKIINSIYDDNNSRERCMKGDLGEYILTDYINNNHIRTKVLYNYELLLESHRIDKLSLGSFVCKKAVNHIRLN